MTFLFVLCLALGLVSGEGFGRRGAGHGETTAWDTHLLRTTDTLNMMSTGTGLAKFPYIRCTRRIIGVFRLALAGAVEDGLLRTNPASGIRLGGIVAHQAESATEK